MAKVTPTIVHFEMPADDVESLSKFYSKVFGWRFEKAPAKSGKHLRVNIWRLDLNAVGTTN